jgi:serine/threonine protein kinase
VYKAVQSGTNAVIAIKEITDLEDDDAIKSEIDILKKCSHPNIVSYYGTISRPEKGALWVRRSEVYLFFFSVH